MNEQASVTVRTMKRRSLARMTVLPLILAGGLASVGSVAAEAADADGELTIGGALRARYDYRDYGDKVSKLSFDTFRIDVNYDSP